VGGAVVTTAELLAVADAATDGPWGVINEDDDAYTVGIYPLFDPEQCLAMDITPEDARLIALAPDLARLAAGMADALRLEHSDYQGRAGCIRGDSCDVCALLARLEALT